MRSILLGFLCFFSFASNAQINYEEGDVVNNFTVTTVAGETFDLYSTTAAGQYVVLHFLGDWNFWDEAITPNMNQAFNAFGCGLSDVAFIGLNYSDNGDVSTQTFIDANNYELPVASFDGGSLAVINDFGVNAYPSVILVGPNNQVLSANMYGGPDGTYDVIQATLSQHSISPSPCVTPIEGCTDPLAFNFDPEATLDDGTCLDLTCELAATLSWADSDFGFSPTQGSGYPGALLDLDFVLTPGLTYTEPGTGNIYAVTSVEPLFVAGVPDGLTLSPAIGDVVTSGGYACYTLSGVAPAAGSYPLVFTVEVEVNVFGLPFVVSSDLTYTLVVAEGDPLEGCTYIGANNYNPAANIENGTCVFSGCTNPVALNYSPIATVDDASCILSETVCGLGTEWDPATGQCVASGCADLTGDGNVDAQDVLALVGQYGTVCE